MSVTCLSSLQCLSEELLLSFGLTRGVQKSACACQLSILHSTLVVNIEGSFQPIFKIMSPLPLWLNYSKFDNHLTSLCPPYPHPTLTTSRGFFPVVVGFIRRIPVLGSILNLPFISAVSISPHCSKPAALICLYVAWLFFLFINHPFQTPQPHQMTAQLLHITVS